MPVERNADLPALHDVADVAALRGLLDGTLHQRLGTAQEALPVLETLAPRVQTPVDDVHGRFREPAQPACFTRMYHSTRRRTCRSV